VRDRVGSSDACAHAHLTAALAFELFLRPGSEEESTRLAEQALTEIRRSGAGERARLAVVQLSNAALLRPELVRRRLALYAETLELARTAGDHAAASTALNSRASDRATLGLLDEARSDLLRSRELAERHHMPQNLVVTGWIASMLLQMEGRLEEAERAIADIEALEATLAMASRGVELAQLANLRELQGRLPELEPVLAAVATRHPAFVELHALSMVAAGRLDELRLRLGPYREQPSIHRDYMWIGLTCIRARYWAALGDQEAVADLRARLEPYADMLAGTIAVTFQGSVRHTLGLLALAAGDREAAAEHLRRAREVHERLGLDVWVARTDELAARL
jgi:tetratricopeptide (TPR) repeat protein